jgi:hypothetical protein
LQAGGRRFDPVWLHQIGGRDALAGSDARLLWLALLLAHDAGGFEVSARHPFLVRPPAQNFVAAVAVK